MDEHTVRTNMIHKAVLVLTLPLFIGMYAALTVGLILGSKLDIELDDSGWLE